MSNKSGTSVISTPSGGGAQSGLGEKFSPDLFTGTGNFSVPIAVPPGRNGFQPELTLQYSTGNGNSPFGLGWGISVPGVMRKTAKGVPLYDDDKDVFILSGAEDLIPVDRPADDTVRYRPRTEGLFAKIDRVLNEQDDYWRVRSKDGLISYYGTPGAKENDPAAVADPDNPRKVFAWKLSKTEDPFGNVIEYVYERDAEREDRFHKWDQVYLKEIRYVDYTNAIGQDKFLVNVEFNYENRPDPFSEYKGGFEVRTVRRCKDIQVFTHPDDGSVIKTRTYHFQYADEVDTDAELPMNGASMLRTIEVEGHDGTESEKLPPLDFRYSQYQPGKQKFNRIGGQLPPGSLAQPQYELADLFGNGLPDLLEMSGGVVQYWRNLGGGEFDMPRSMKEAPSGFNLGDADVQMIDADGDGRVDLMINSPNISGYFPSRFGGAWDKDSFKKYRQAPSFSLQDPEVKLVDLSGDGVTDAIRSGSSFECFFNDEHDGWTETRRIGRKQIDDFPNVNFSDPRIKWADMSGDGMQDLVYVTSGTIHYWPNLGHGRFGKRVQMRSCPKYPQAYDPARIQIGDVDGDGLADVVYVDYNKVTVWINQAGNRFSEPVEITNTPPVAEPDAIRLEDLYGNGTSGVLFSIQNTTVQRHTMYFLDLTGGIKPYLLHEMDNNMGALTRVHYEGSIKHYLRDQAKKESRWKTSLPFPVQVVSQVEVIDKISKGKLTTQYLYHHGHWDGGEREFRGFGRVDQRDTETFERYNSETLHSDSVIQSGSEGSPEFQEVNFEHYTPPTETRNWFHLGPVGDEFGDWQEVYFEDEYWEGDPSVLQRSQEVSDLLIALPRRAKRDALRAMRGSQLRTELYALDARDATTGDYIPGAGGRPYTVTESQFGVRIEFDPTEDVIASEARQSHSGHIFFTFSEGSRTTQWERGYDPMTQLSFTADYDIYGQPLKQIAIAVPRGRDYTASGGASIDGHPFDGWQNDPYLATVSRTEYAQKDSEQQYMVDRACRSISYEVVNSGNMSAFELRDQILQANLPVQENLGNYNIIGHSVNFYDGPAFTGLDHGQLGDYGALVKSETLVLTQDIVNEAYGSTPLALQESPTWAPEYPNEFQTSVPNELGYEFHNEADYTEGWYSVTQQMEYDFQVSVGGKGLMTRSKDPLGNETEVIYDEYELLPLTVTQKQDSNTDLTTTAQYDYRVLQADMITEPNGNRSQFRFSPLGLLERTAVLGKVGGTDEGDDIDTAPGTQLEYDFLAYSNDQQPVWVKTIKREYHIHDNDVPFGADADATIATVEYTDGFGRLLQTRTQAEDVLFGNTLFGDSGLPEEQGQNGNAVGVQRPASALPNVVVSGWQVYNNKGKVVEQYEPYFSSGFQYQSGTLSEVEGSGAAKVRMFYDPRGQVVRTVNPDAAEQWVLFGKPPVISGVELNAVGLPEMYDSTPWESYTFDANDLAPRTHPQNSGVPVQHHWTPSSSLLDPLGRTIQTIDRNGPAEADQVVMQYEFDIRGNLKKVTDALGRIAFTHVYDLKPKGESEEDQGANILKTEHLDSGTKTALFDTAYRPIELRDAKGSLVLHAYDQLNRPTRIWARDVTVENTTLRQKLIYGDDATDGPTTPTDTNHLGKLYQHYDEAGKVTLEDYDFKGNVLQKKREVIADSEIKATFNGPPANWDVPAYRVDHDSNPTLEGEYVTDMEYDALNRMKKMVYPEDQDTERKELVPTYNNAGALEKVTMDGDPYVNHIAYNAKGQRLLIALGNGVMTRYAYDQNTFRLSRMRSEQYTQIGWEFEYQSGTNRQDIGFDYDLNGNIIRRRERRTDCGISGSLLGADALDRLFSYDPLNRLLSASGRESNTQNQNDYTYSSSPRLDNYPNESGSSPNANNVRAYNRNYAYDKVGNIQSMTHNASGNNFTRSFNYTNGVNTLLDIRTGGGSLIEDHTYDSNGNLIAAGTTRNYEWDHSDQLRCYFNQAGTNEPTIYAHYLYDAAGNRVKKLVRTSSTDWEGTVYIDGTFEYHKKETSTDTIEKNYLHVMDDKSRVAQRRIGTAFPDDLSEDRFYVLDDHLGSSNIRIHESTGAMLDREEYFPFGDSSLRTFSKKRYRYVGKEKDLESGLYYYGARYYSAWTCRFISVDALASDYAQLTPYNYSNNGPVDDLDIDGNQDTETKKSVSGKVTVGPMDSGERNQATGELENGVYKIEKGDTLTGIAKRFGTTIEDIAQKNNISDPNKIYAGDSLTIGAAYTADKPAFRETDYYQKVTGENPIQEVGSVIKYIAANYLNLPNNSKITDFVDFQRVEDSNKFARKTSQHSDYYMSKKSADNPRVLIGHAGTELVNEVFIQNESNLKIEYFDMKTRARYTSANGKPIQGLIRVIVPTIDKAAGGRQRLTGMQMIFDVGQKAQLDAFLKFNKEAGGIRERGKFNRN